MFKSITNLIYHISILVLGATIAPSLPYTGKLIADNYLTYWTLIESEKPFLISVEIAVAVLLINILQTTAACSIPSINFFFRDGAIRLSRNTILIRTNWYTGIIAEMRLKERDLTV